MSYKARTSAEIAAARTAAIQASKPIVAKGECHMCGWSLGKGALYCSAMCASDFAAEVKAHKATP